MNLKSIDTPAFILDKGIMQANINRMHDKAKALGVTLRPHVKTSKCWEVVRRQLWSKEGPITVSTLKEAEEFALHGVTDMIYAVGIAPQKLPRVAALYEKGVDLKIILDNVASANAVSTFCKTHHYAFKVLIEIDCDGHRSGLRPNDPEIINVAKAIAAPAILSGVITHAGGSYDVDTEEALIKTFFQVPALSVKQFLSAQRLLHCMRITWKVLQNFVQEYMCSSTYTRLGLVRVN